METYALNYTGEQINSKLEEINNKQDKLTAGEGITISEDNVISTTKIYKHRLSCTCYDEAAENNQASYIFYVFNTSSTPISDDTSLDVGDFIYGVGYKQGDEIASCAPLMKKTPDYFYLAGGLCVSDGIDTDEVTPL